MTNLVRKFTVSVLVTPDELATIKEAAHIVHLSVSAFIAARVGEALASRQGWNQALGDMLTLQQRQIPAKLRTKRSSAVIDIDTHGKLTATATKQHVTAHTVMQAISVIGSERVLSGRGVYADATRPLDFHVSRALSALRQAHNSAVAGIAEEDGFAKFGAAAAMMRAKLVTMTRVVGHGSQSDFEKQLMRMPRDARDLVFQLSGWIGLPPLIVYVAAVRKAQRDKDPIADN